MLRVTLKKRYLRGVVCLVSTSGYVARDGGRVLQVPLLLLPDGTPEPEGDVRPPALPAGELVHPTVPPIPAWHHPPRCGLFLPHG